MSENENKLKELYSKNMIVEKNNILYVKDSKKFVCGYGNSNSKIIFIGEAPGAEEEEQGIPFCGRSGKLLTTILNKYNFNYTNYFITNVVKFRPPNNRKPLTKEITIHGKLLIEEIVIINPNIIIPIGSTATSFIFNKKNISISSLRGKKVIINNKLVFPIFHPSYILRNINLLPLFEKDINLLHQICIDNNFI